MKRISYFTYSVDEISNQGFTNAMLNVNHDRTTHYYDVQSVNKWLKKLGNELYDKNMLEVYGFNESSLTSYSKYSSDIKASKAGIISMFSDKSYLLVNTAIAENKDNTFTFTSLSGLEYYDTLTNKWVKITSDVSNNFFTISYSKNQITIKPGYCILLKGGSYWRNAGEWKQDSNKQWHYYDPNGKEIKNSWIKNKAYWYYLNTEGVMLTGWQYVAWNGVSNWFYFADSSGEMLTNWQKLKWSGGTNWFYLGKDGAMVSNKCQKIDGQEYCFNASGVCYKGSGC